MARRLTGPRRRPYGKRMRWFFNGLAALAAAAVITPIGVFAQTGNAGSVAPRPQLGPTDFLNAALSVVAAVDRYEMADIWDKSSPIMKTSIPKDRFIASTAQNRAALGAVGGRDWSAIMRVVIAEKNGPLPPGRYMSVRFNTAGQNGATMEEVISFHLDADGLWKLAGYTINRR